MVIGIVVVLFGVVIGWWTVSGSGIHERPNGGKDGPASKEYSDSPLDSPWDMAMWSRGTQSSARRRRC
jgi:hypothetical protein